MNTRIDDEDLKRLVKDQTYTAGLSQTLVTAFRRRMQEIDSAHDERDFYKMRSLHFEKLKGERQNQYSVRLNAQFRLILELEGTGSQKTVVVKGIEDYH